MIDGFKKGYKCQELCKPVVKKRKFTLIRRNTAMGDYAPMQRGVQYTKELITIQL